MLNFNASQGLENSPPMIATLPMYDWPEIRDATDRFWAGLAKRLSVDFGLSRLPDYTAAWSQPDLLFSQTCGYPFTHGFRSKLTYLATPNYTVDGCVGPNYCSMIFARDTAALADFRNARAAVNTPDSMSGMLALQLVFSPFAKHGEFFGSTLETGSHIASLAAVREGRADVCSIDAVAVGLARQYRLDYLKGLVEIARSPLVPGLPFVTKAVTPTVLQSALEEHFTDPDYAEDRATLLLSGLSILEPKAYDRILELETAMRDAGGLQLF
jgi:ABC-type phosphate/phosphonate transport system substrate-binding protein